MFAPGNQTCGSNCNSKRRKRSDLENESSTIFGGWTPYYTSDDYPDGTGDHEHYFHFRGEEKDWSYRGKNAEISIVYGKDGQAYKNCNRTAIHARTKNTHVLDFREIMTNIFASNINFELKNEKESVSSFYLNKV